MSIKNRERDVEAYLVSGLEKINLPCLKFDPSNRTGMPDRVVLLPSGKVVWVELKTDNGHLSQLQLLRHKELERLGHEVVVIWNKEDADNFISGIREAL